MKTTYLSPDRVGELLGVSAAAVSRWIEAGELETARDSAAEVGVEPSALRAFLIRSARPLPAELIGARTLLIMDDEPSILRSTARMLQIVAPELDIETAEGARQGLAIIEAALPDAVVVDTHMPEMSGVEVCAQIKCSQRTAHIPVIAMTGDSSPELREAFDRAGAAALLEKPVDARALFDALSVGLVV